MGLCLGIQFSRNENKLILFQRGYILETVEHFGMANSYSISTPIDFSVQLKKTEQSSEYDIKYPYR